MKNLKYLLFLIIGVAFLGSCEYEERDVDMIKDSSPNFVTYEKLSQTVANLADGKEYTFEVMVKVDGPTVAEMSGDIQVELGVDAPNSTAVEGTHVKLANKTVTLTKANNYLAKVEITHLTAGQTAPQSKLLALKIASVSSSENVIASGKNSKVTLNYSCPSYLAGTYTVTVLRDGAQITPYSTVVITETGLGEYRTDEVGHWPQASLGGNPGFTFTDVCGELSIPQQNLVDLYSNQVQGTKPGRVNADGSLEMEYSITSSWSSVYTCVYVPVK